ncbi:hypothetical protein B0H13DRAFT_2116308, partial [Mycena leptocephala]
MLQLLHLAPNLVECVFAGLSPVYNIDIAEATAKKLILPNLRRLIFGGKLESPDSDDEILTHLSLPALETLSLWLDISGNDLLSFFLLSSPPLQELVVGPGAVRDEALGQLHECFRLIPTLLRLEIHAGCPFLTELFDSLADSSSLLPNMHKLVIHLDPSDVPDSFWKTVLRALSARHTQLKIVDMKLTADAPESLKPPADCACGVQRTGCRWDAGAN